MTHRSRSRHVARSLCIRIGGLGGTGAGAPTQGAAHEPRIALAGEMGDWWTPLDLTLREALEAPAGLEGDEGSAAATIDLSLPEGVYAYKLLVDGVFTLDPGNPRTRASDGHRNNVLSLGGAPEPILFAPAPPFVTERRRGGVMVYAALRRGHGQRLAVRWTEDPAIPEQKRELEMAAEEEEHILFQARLPVSTARFYARFELDDGRVIGREGSGEAFVIERSPAFAGPPAWWKDAVVYTIFVDRFRPAADGARWGVDPGPNRPAGGHLEGVRRSLAELSELGINSIYLTPLHVAASCHRYDVVDPLRVDPALGGEAALRRLLDDAHERGMRVIVDLALTHAGRGMVAYEDVIQRGRQSVYAGWFQWTRARGLRGLRGTDSGEPQLVHYGSRRDAPRFDLGHPEVRDLAVRAAAYWAELGVDGLRLDAAAEVPFDLARAIRKRLREIRPDAVLFGEVVPLHTWRWLAEEAVDAATDFAFHSAITDFTARRSIDAEELARRLAAIDRARGGPAEEALRFVSTHDHTRLATIARRAGELGVERARLALLLLLTSPGVPSILYGEEIGLASESADREPEDVWPDRMPMPWKKGSRDEATRALVKSLLALRRRTKAIVGGELSVLFAEGAILIYRRSAGGEVVDIAVNVSAEAVAFDIEDDERPLVDLILAAGEASVEGQSVSLGPASGAVLLRGRASGVGRSSRGAFGHRQLELLANSRMRDSELAEGALTVRSRPSRIDLSITERCNLQCLHCITLAPDKTRGGTARTLSPWLLDRLRDAFEAAAYVGFVHGGEPLTAPILFDVLAAIRAARPDNPAMVHLLTNGLLLTERTAARLIEAGVRSISVSLDGASAETNDAIRAGGRFDSIVANVRGAALLRRATGADLRLGVSSVLMRQNAHEIERLVELCADLGVDWLKLEEAVPATPFAARSLLWGRGGARDAESGVDAAPSEGSPRVLEAIQRAIQRGRELGIVVVDHTVERSIWRCKLDEQPDVREALLADEFANRSEIHPCRVPWEHACIEPNGDIKMGTFFSAVLGSVAEEPLGAIWNGPVARAERLRSIASRLCGGGPVTCVPAPAARGR